MFRTIRIRTKLAVALAVPLLALVAVAGYEVVEANRDVDRTRSQTELATSSLGPGSLVTRLQDERNRVSLDLVGLDTELPVDTFEEARELTDDAAETFRADIAGRGGAVAEAFGPAFEALDDLADLRDDIDRFDGPMDLSNDEFADEVFTRYTDITEAFFDATSGVALAVDGAELRNGVEIVDAATRQSEMRARIVRGLVLGVLTGSIDDPEVGQGIAGLLDRSRGFDDDIRTNATGPYEGVGDPTFEEADVRSFVEQVETFLAEGELDINSILDAVQTGPEIGYIGLRGRAADLLTAEADRVEDEAVARQRLFLAVAGGTLLLAALVTWLASRSITRPLRSLRNQAEEMAATSLPAAVRQILETPPGEDVVIPQIEPVAVKTRDEVREVAAALSAVQTSAVDLAVEQAVLRRNISDSYINLGRRNQNLLSRQLDFITDLERNEGDPDTLEDLFRLDHLATRMRRNAESLLVLAGVDPPRQWSAPVQLSDVVRAALGEVEDYKRVVVRHLEPAAMVGAIASDVAHVLAELIENGLSFSPPDQTVDVKGRLTTSGYTLAITDNGMGMAPEELERANRRLAGRESFTVAPSRYLGHYVAGHLATRHGVQVELQDSPAGGITARIDIPLGLIADDELDAARSAAASAADAPVVAATGAEAAPEAAPSAGPVPAAPSAGTTLHGLPRRGERPAVPPAPAATTDLPAPPAAPAADSVAMGASAGQPLTAAAPPAGPVPPPPFDAPAVPSVAPAASTTPPVPATADPEAPPDPAAPADRTARHMAGRGVNGLPVSQPSHGSMYSIAARAARGDAPVPGPGAGYPPGGPGAGSTPSGLSRRVPGAQRPDLPPAPLGHAPGPAAADEPPRSTPEDVYSFLSSFQSGVERGRAETHDDDDAIDPQEDSR